MRIVRVHFMLLLLISLPLVVHAQSERVIDEIQDDTNPTKPVFLSVREEYSNLTQDKNLNLLIFRSDKVILKKTKSFGPKGIILRYDLPLATADTGSTSTTGLSDLYMQALFFPRLSRFTIAAGSGMILPTATGRSLGRGKWQIVPLAVPIWSFTRNKGFLLVRFQDYLSFAGQGDRPDIHYFVTAPALMWRYTRKSWILLDSEAKTNWERGGTTSFRSGVQIGAMLNRHVGVWVKPEFPWGEHREGDWTLKFTLILAR